MSVLIKTSSPKSSPPSAFARDGNGHHWSSVPSSPQSPAVSSTSTADGEGSPEIPSLQAPGLPERVQEILRTPPKNKDGEERKYVTASWGSPYPQSDTSHRRRSSLSSEPSDSSPAHHLEIHTPFLRPVPYLEDSHADTQADQHPSSLVSATVLANRARRPARGLTEDWIRQHTSGDGSTEARHWLSDGTGDSENSSLSGSFSGEEAGWLEDGLKTPRAVSSSSKGLHRASQRYPRTRSSNETLKQADVHPLSSLRSVSMASPEPDKTTPDGVSDHTLEDALPDAPSTPKLKTGRMNGSMDGPRVGFNLPQTPTRSPMKQQPPMTPRLKKKVPWKGKNIMILLPRDDERGKPGGAPAPVTGGEVSGMLRAWEELGYTTRGFDLEDVSPFAEADIRSQSRKEWPTWDDIAVDREKRSYKVTLPDLNAWKTYVEELQEAKLRALGVSFGDEEPPPSSISPAATSMSRQASVTHYPPLPFSPPLPSSSAASNHGAQQFPFPTQFMSSGTQSPAIPSAPSPVPFNGKLNPRQSISIPAAGFQMPGQLPTPHAFSPQAILLQHGHARGGSPSLANLHSMMSPTSPFQPEGFQAPLHQRHQSLQYPMLPHQQFQGARASPRLQEVREVDEETVGKSPSRTPEPAPSFIRHNASDSLQKEIDEAEYHLEEQFRSQFENDKDYSPHDEKDTGESPDMPDRTDDASLAHAREPSVQFASEAPPVERFREDSENAVMHHPRPHSRGHSLSQKYYTEQDEHRDSTKRGGFGQPKARQDESYEIETNPSNLGTPIQQAMDFGHVLEQHQRSFSTASNPWSDGGSARSGHGAARKASHGSKASISGLNVAAPEFKFNPASSFQPGQFSFSSNSFQPAVFQASTGFNTANVPKPPLSAQSSQFSFGSSKINVNAPVFSPGQSDFSFSASGPKFRPDAPAFTPLHSFSNSLTSPPPSGSESVGNPGSSIFGNIDISMSKTAKPTKKSKAIPIVRPPSRDTSGEAETQYDQEGRIVDETRVKRAKANADDGDDVPLFAEPSAPTPLTEAEPQPEELPQTDSIHVDVKSGDEHGGDTTLSSTMNSEATEADAKAATSPSEISSNQSGMNWAPFEFKSPVDMQEFNTARPFGEDIFGSKKHKKTLSAAARPFIPGMSLESLEDDTDEDTNDEFMDDAAAVQVKAGAETEAETEDRDAEGETVDETLELGPSPESALPTLSSIGMPDEAVAASTPPPPPAKKKGLSASRFASSPSPPPQPKPAGLSASRYAVSPQTVSEEDKAAAEGEDEQPLLVSPQGLENPQGAFSDAEELPAATGSAPGPSALHEPTVDEIDEILRQIDETDPTMGVNRIVESPQWHHPSPQRHISLAAVTNSSPLHLPPLHEVFRSDAPSPSPKRYRLQHEPLLSTELEDPFVDPPTQVDQFSESNIHHLQGSETVPDSDWDGAFSDEEQTKLESRVNYFDGRVNEVVGGLLAARLRPLEKTLDSIQLALNGPSKRPTSSRLDRRSTSAEIQHSDADDEDDDIPVARRSMSPRRDRRLEQMRVVVLETLAAQQRNMAPPVVAAPQPGSTDDLAAVMKAMEEMKEQFTQSLHLDFRGEDLRNIVEDAVERRMVPTPQPVVVQGQEDLSDKLNELQARVVELEQHLRVEESKVEREAASRRAAEDSASELNRKLQMAETKIEVEIMNRSVFDQRVADLEDRLKHQEDKTEEEVSARRTAEDRLAENQRLLRISSEEETRLRETLEERDQKIKSMEESRGKTTMRLALLEAAQANGQKSQIDFQNRLNATEAELREASQEARKWRAEAERTNSVNRQQGGDLEHLNDENKRLKKLIDTLSTQLEENERIRESWRAKFGSLQDDMGHAATQITEENARRAKKEQELLARQEVLDAKLQAEARTRERLESELERLESGERQGLRAVNECKRLETLLSELRGENHQLQQSSLRYQAEFQEARESGAREVQRTRDSMQSEVEEANHQVNLVREELEDQVARVRAQLDQVKLEADTAKAKHEMLLEEAQTTKKAALEELARKHQNETEDLQADYERQLSNTTEDAQRAEQNLLERLSISNSKSKHLQDRVDHLEEKLEIAKEAALAAAKAAKVASPPVAQQPTLQSAAAIKPAALAASRALDLPEKISPQALRESIMVLQEQLQQREQRIEELEHTLSMVDPEAASKITKRDDEIVWLRELLAVRHSDMHDIIAALDSDEYDRVAVKDAAIRLKANLQMEEQERERAMNGGSAITLPNIAATIRDATPRGVAQAVGPLAAAWGNWRKSRDTNGLASLSGVLSSPAPASSGGGSGSGSNSTPSKNGLPSQSSFLSGLLTPPASGLRQTPTSAHGQPGGQPTAFSNTGRRLTAQQLANRRTFSSSANATPRQTAAADKMPAARLAETPQRRPNRGPPVTPPMMRNSSYDSDAHAEEFDDAGFFDDE